MKERPILFSAPMVRAILDGRKTQTRRALKPQPDAVQNGIIGPLNGAGNLLECRHGKIGDRLWVRETFRTFQYPCGDELDTEVEYRATPISDSDYPLSVWRPSIFMPRKYSRITLEITDIRVERLNDISEADAIAEGIQQYKGPLRWMRYLDAVTGEANFNSARDAFVSLWESINGAGSWAANPWVRAISFKRVTP